MRLWVTACENIISENLAVCDRRSRRHIAMIYTNYSNDHTRTIHLTSSWWRVTYLIHRYSYVHECILFFLTKNRRKLILGVSWSHAGVTRVSSRALLFLQSFYSLYSLAVHCDFRSCRNRNTTSSHSFYIPLIIRHETVDVRLLLLTLVHVSFTCTSVFVSFSWTLFLSRQRDE